MTGKNVNGMGIGVFQILPDRPSGDPAVVAKHAEELGFASYWVPEHAVIPDGSCEDYPAATPGEPPPDYLYKMPDPMIALARASAATSTIGLGTGIALVPERNPLTAAKEIASIDHYSGGRMLYGIGAGWNEAECTVMGGDFPRRWTQTKEAIEVMRLLWTGDYVEYHGKYYDFPKLICKPKPHQNPHPPILLASVANPRVYKRVGQWADGWLPIVGDPQELAEGKAEIAKHAIAADRDPEKLAMNLFAPNGLFRTRSELTEAAAAGANNTIVWLQGNDEKEILAELGELAATIF